MNCLTSRGCDNVPVAIQSARLRGERACPDIVRAGGFLHPPRIGPANSFSSFDGFEDIPFLVGIHHQLLAGPIRLRTKKRHGEDHRAVNRRLQLEMPSILHLGPGDKVPDSVIRETNKPAGGVAG